VFWLVNLYPLLVYIEHNGDESPEDNFPLLPVLHSLGGCRCQKVTPKHE